MRSRSRRFALSFFEPRCILIFDEREEKEHG
jgi:hypothetical protein